MNYAVNDLAGFANQLCEIAPNQSYNRNRRGVEIAFAVTLDNRLPSMQAFLRWNQKKSGLAKSEIGILGVYLVVRRLSYPLRC